MNLCKEELLSHNISRGLLCTVLINLSIKGATKPMQMIDHYLKTTGFITRDNTILLGYIHLAFGNKEAWKKQQKAS